MENKKLTEEQKQWIEDNIDEIKYTIAYYAKIYKNTLLINFSHLNNAIEFAESYIPELLLSYNPKKDKGNNLINYLGTLSVFRTIDSHKRKNYVQLRKFCNASNHLENESVQETDLIEWEDTKRYITKKLQQHKNKNLLLIFENYLVPMSEGNKISVEDVSKQIGISRSRIYYLISSEEMKRAIKEIV